MMMRHDMSVTGYDHLVYAVGICVLFIFNSLIDPDWCLFQVNTQPKSDSEEPKPGIEAQLNSHVHALWNEQIPICIEVS